MLSGISSFVIHLEIHFMKYINKFLIFLVLLNIGSNRFGEEKQKGSSPLN